MKIWEYLKNAGLIVSVIAALYFVFNIYSSVDINKTNIQKLENEFVMFKDKSLSESDIKIIVREIVKEEVEESTKTVETVSNDVKLIREYLLNRR